MLTALPSRTSLIATASADICIYLHLFACTALHCTDRQLSTAKQILAQRYAVNPTKKKPPLEKRLARAHCLGVFKKKLTSS